MMMLPIVCAGGLSGRLEEPIRRADIKVIKEYPVELVIVVLSRMDQHLVALSLQGVDDPAIAG